MKKTPKLRTVERYKPPYPLNGFPEEFPYKLAKEVVYLLATRKTPKIEGSDWEEIFSRIIGAQWKPSNVGLDDIVLKQTAWGAKTVKNANPFKATKVRLISGRNSPVYSYGITEVSECDPDELGEQILEIWNERVASIRSRYKHVRTVVLIKSEDLLRLSVFEFDTVIYPTDQYNWRWNSKNNLEGFCKESNEHVFTWQPHGSQFTIIENVPSDRLSIKIKDPPKLDAQKVLDAIKFDKSWVEIVSNG